MVRGVYINRASAEKPQDLYLAKVSASEHDSTTYTENHKAKALTKIFGIYSLAAMPRSW